MGESHPLLTFFMDAADGCFPPVDGRLTVLPPLPGGLECSLAFTGHAVVATAMTDQAVCAQGPDGYGASLSPDFLRYLTGPKGWIGVTDATLTARGMGGPPRLTELADADDPRRAAGAEYRTPRRSGRQPGARTSTSR
ncbi:hypothetical protein [Streptomyces sp. TRM68367]|uniref:hypothetical protein n=1 Tax=Streptomyces sp. TRM68367 TaxID=2758415 RepID=UPI0021D1001D|nr:hypothetical protein [Streptomyces sp. TRM68367]